MSAARRDLLILFALALAANGLASRFISQPGYTDAYYYFGGAVQLARGQGFSEPYVWNYLALPAGAAGLPVPSHLYWMPLTSLAAAPFIALAEALAGRALPAAALFRAAQAPFVLLASALPALSYLVARRASGLRRHAVAAALLTLFAGFYFVFWANTDAFALFGLAAGGALYCLGRSTEEGAGSRQSRWLLAAGALAGLAHLARADGVFVLLAGLAWLVRLGDWRLGDWRLIKRHLSLVIGHLSFVIAPYLLLTAPWFLRNTLVLGAPLAPGAARTVWLTEYNDLFSLSAQALSPARYFAQGWGAIAGEKWSAFVTNLGTLVGPLGLIVAFPFILTGLWKLRRHPLFGPAILYSAVLFGLMTLVFTFPGARGGLFHSGAALLPFFFPAALVGLDAAVDAAAGRLRHWQPERSRPVFTILLVACAVGLTGAIFQLRVIGADWRSPRFGRANQAYAEMGAWLAGQAASPGEIVAANDPPGFYYFTGRPSIVIPNGGPDELLRAMARFGAHWVVLDANHPAGLAGLYSRPDSEPRLRLSAAFVDESGRPVYVLALVQSE